MTTKYRDLINCKRTNSYREKHNTEYKQEKSVQYISSFLSLFYEIVISNIWTEEHLSRTYI